MKKIQKLLTELPEHLKNSIELLFPTYGITNMLFFDIETTGLSAKTSSLYLIGACYYCEREGQFVLVQFFAEEFDEECVLLTEFFQLAQNFSVLVHYNGKTFDLPYLNTKCELLELPFRFDMENIDIYHFFHKDTVFFRKERFSLENKKQKTMEILAGFQREDTFSGKELIRIYGDYKKAHMQKQKKEETDLVSTILLHNHDDLCGLVRICPLLGYTFLFSGKTMGFSLTDCSVSAGGTIILSLNFKTDFTFLPILNKKTTAITIPSLPLCHIELSEHTLFFQISACYAELKFFYPDYKNYYYLPEEDMAVHKSIANFVDKNRRKKATPNSCYIKKSGYFFPQPGKNPPITPAFYQEYQGETSYFEWNENLPSQKEALLNYALSLFLKDVEIT
jgi:hypothetical protein